MRNRPLHARAYALGALSVLAVAQLHTPTAAGAHAELVGSTPRHGQQLPGAPTHLLLQLTDAVERGSVAILDSRGDQVGTVATTMDAIDPTLVLAALPELRDGVYTIRWEVLSGDGHSTSGSLAFAVGTGQLRPDQLRVLYGADEAHERLVRPLEPPIRGLLYLALVILVGAPLTLLLVVGPALGETTTVAPVATAGRAAGHHTGAAPFAAGAALVTAAAGGALAASIVLLLLPLTALSDRLTPAAIWHLIGTTRLGQIGAARVLLAAAIVGGGVLLRVRRAPRSMLALALVGGVLLQLTVSLTSHTAGLSAPEAAAWLWFDAAHLVGGAVWAGGLVTLALLVPPAMRSLATAEARNAAAAALIGRFSPLALLALAVAAASGLLLTSLHVPRLRSLSETFYGNTLTIKLLLLVAALLLASVLRLVVLRRLNAGDASAVRWFTIAVRGELAFLVAVLLISGVLTSAPTADTVERVLAQPPQRLVQRILVSEQDDIDLVVLVTVSPGTVGINLFEVAIRPHHGKAPPIDGATLLLRSPGHDLLLPEVPLTPQSKFDLLGSGGFFAATSSLPLAGEWRLAVRANVAGHSLFSAFELAAVQQPAATPRQGSFQRLLRWAALAAILAAVSVAASLRLADRRRRGSHQVGARNRALRRPSHAVH